MIETRLYMVTLAILIVLQIIGIDQLPPGQRLLAVLGGILWIWEVIDDLRNPVRPR